MAKHKGTPYSVLELDRVRQIAQRRAAEQGVSIIWDETATTASTTKDGTIRLPVLMHPITKEKMQRVHGYIVHETGHLLRNEAFDILNAARPDDMLFSLFNITEDDGMERWQAHRYAGDAMALGTANNGIVMEAHAKFFNDKSAKHWETCDERDLQPITMAAMHQMSRSTWDHWSTESLNDLIDRLPPRAMPILGDLIDKGYLDRMRTTTDPHSTWDLACDLYAYFNGGDKRTPEEQQALEETRARGHSKVPGDKKDGEGAGTGEGIGKLKEDKKEHFDPDSLENECVTVNWKDVIFSDHNKDFTPGQGGGLKISWDGYHYGSKQVGIMPDELIDVVDYTKTKGFDATFALDKNKDKRKAREYKHFMPNSDDARALGNRVRRMIQAEDRIKRSYDRHSGHINKKDIVRLVLPPVDGGDWNKRIFYDWSKKAALNTAIMLVVDWSGSMSGKKMAYAADACQRCITIFDRVLNVPTMAVAFTTGTDMCKIGIIKRFGKKESPESVALHFAEFSKYTSGNNDGDSLMWAYRRLVQRKEPRKIMIVLSDGAPADVYVGSPDGNLRGVTQAIQDSHKVDLYGIGIQSKDVQRYYKNYTIINQPQDINQAILDVLAKKVRHN